MLQSSGGDKNRLDPQVILDKKLLEAGPVHPFNRLQPSQDRKAQGMAGPERFVEHVVDVLIGRILDHVDLLDDHLAFFFQLSGRESGIQVEIEEQVQGDGEVLGQDFGIKARELLAGEGVEDPPHGVDLLGDLAGGPAFRPLEEHVLDKVSDPVLFPILIPRARVNPDSHGDGMNAGDLFGDDLNPVFQCGFDDHNHFKIADFGLRIAD